MMVSIMVEYFVMSADSGPSDDCLYDHKFLTDDVLGLDHMDKSGKRTNGAFKDGALVIKG